MTNPYTQYYLNQVGGSMPHFAGVRYQRGHGFFGRLFSGIGGFLKELVPSLGKKALPSAINFAQDIISGENVGKSAKSRFKQAGKDIANETLDQIKSKLQSGSGIPHITLGKRSNIRFLNPQNKKRKVKKNKKKSNKRHVRKR